MGRIVASLKGLCQGSHSAAVSILWAQPRQVIVEPIGQRQSVVGDLRIVLCVVNDIAQRPVQTTRKGANLVLIIDDRVVKPFHDEVGG